VPTHAADPEQAIVDHLARPAGRFQGGPPSPSGWRSGVVVGGNMVKADLDTIRFVKFREAGLRRLYFVTFMGSISELGLPEPLGHSYVFPVTRGDAGSWVTSGGAGGGGPSPTRGVPWINLAGGGWPSRFYAGGVVETAGAPVAAVELRFADGTVLTDDIGEGVALFITDGPVTLPATVMLLDGNGGTVATHRFPH
jgi:hypothetical protein